MNRRLLLTAMLTLSLAACASTGAPPPEERDPIDPWEPYNRSMWMFNVAVDQVIVRPVAIGYDRVTPSPVKTGVNNFFTNLRSPAVIFNLLLQGRGTDAGEQFGRFFVNTLFGAAGIFDVATLGGAPKHEGDVGQTLATWGWEESRFFMLPLIGPSTVRDGVGRGVDSYPNVAVRLAREEGAMGLLALDIIDTRAAILPLDEQIREAFDPYIFVRDGWLQRRNRQIHGDDAPLPDYDSFLDDDWDEDW